MIRFEIDSSQIPDSVPEALSFLEGHLNRAIEDLSRFRQPERELTGQVIAELLLARILDAEHDVVTLLREISKIETGE